MQLINISYLRILPVQSEAIKSSLNSSTDCKAVVYCYVQTKCAVLRCVHSINYFQGEVI